MNKLHRRSLLSRMGMGAGALLLAPVVGAIDHEARGATPTRKRAVFFLHGNGLNHRVSFTPPEFKQGTDTAYAVMDGPKSYTWPAMLAPLAKHRARMLLVDGLPNRPKSGASQHGTGFSALSCFAAAHGGSNEANGSPGGITIDQFIANGIGAQTRAKSVLFGASTRPVGVYGRTFASGIDKPEPHFQSPSLMFDDLFGALIKDGAGVARGAYKQKALIDGMRADVARARAGLGASERRKLDHYVTAIEDFSKRLSLAGTLTCVPPGAPTAVTTVEDRLEAMNEMATVALVCGMTNVVGISVGCGDAHVQFPTYGRIHKGTQFEASGGIGHHGHSPDEVAGPAWDLIHQFNLGLVARMADALAAIPEGDGTALDNTVFLYMSDNGGEHHSKHERHPLVLLGSAGKKLKVDGRFIRYPKRGLAGSRSMADLYCTIATACGVPTETFGMGGNEPVKGPLSEILA